MTSECPLEVTQQEFDSLRGAEAVVVREYETEDGRRFARAVAWGDWDEMEDQAAIPGLFIVPVGFRIVGQRAVRTAELLGAEALQ